MGKVGFHWEKGTRSREIRGWGFKAENGQVMRGPLDDWNQRRRFKSVETNAGGERSWEVEKSDVRWSAGRWIRGMIQWLRSGVQGMERGMSTIRSGLDWQLRSNAGGWRVRTGLRAGCLHNKSQPLDEDLLWSKESTAGALGSTGHLGRVPPQWA